MTISKGKILKQDELFFSRTCVKEELFEFRNGVLIKRRIINNYIKVKNAISRLNIDAITDTFFARVKDLNWEKLSTDGCSRPYYVTIDDKGKVGSISFYPYSKDERENNQDSIDHKDCLLMMKTHLKNLQFDVIKWNGQSYNEQIFFDPVYTKYKKTRELVSFLIGAYYSVWRYDG